MVRALSSYLPCFTSQHYAGTVKPIVDSVHTFDQVGVMAAYEKLMSKRAVGKVVVKVEK